MSSTDIVEKYVETTQLDQSLQVVLPQQRRGYMVVKRVFDVFFSLIALVVLFPVMLLIALGIMIDDPMGGSPVFLQDRLGRGMKPFKCIKFRTMRKDAPHNSSTRTLADAKKHITGVGNILRKTSIDELPQLWNVIRGEMSLVGPRPLILSEMDVHEKRNRQGIYNIRPGLTGLAQIKGRDLVNDEAKVDFDYQYYINLSFKLDIEIILRTILKIIMMDGIVEGMQGLREDMNVTGVSESRPTEGMKEDLLDSTGMITAEPSIKKNALDQGNI